MTPIFIFLTPIFIFLAFFPVALIAFSIAALRWGPEVWSYFALLTGIAFLLAVSITATTDTTAFATCVP